MSTAVKLFERFFHDFSLRDLYFKKYLSPQGYVLARHNFYILVGLYGSVNAFWPFNPSFPTIGLCPRGYEGTWVCEKDKHKALEMYKAYKEGKKYEAAKH